MGANDHNVTAGEHASNDRTTFMSPEVTCLDEVHKKGFTDEFKFDGSSIVSLSNDRRYAPADISVVNFYRFEGVSDPDDMSIIYVIQTVDGRKGTLTDAYGLYADGQMGNFMKQVENFAKQPRGWK